MGDFHFCHSDERGAPKQNVTRSGLDAIVDEQRDGCGAAKKQPTEKLPTEEARGVAACGPVFGRQDDSEECSADDVDEAPPTVGRKDRRAAVKAALRESPSESNSALAKRLKVGPRLVRAVRAEVAAEVDG